MMGLHHGSPKVVELEVGLHHRCPGSDQEITQGGEASDGASPWESQSSGVHNGVSLWKFRGE